LTTYRIRAWLSRSPSRPIDPGWRSSLLSSPND
jgi:hypothetical protein